MWYLCVHPVIEAPTLFCVTNGCTTNAAGDLQGQRNVEESEEASKLSVFANKKNSTRTTDCPVRLCLRRQRNHLAVTAYFLEHNHKLSKFLYDRLPVNRRLTEDELSTCRALLKYGTPSCEVRQFVADEFDDMPSVLAKLRETGRVLVWQSEEGHYNHICFSRWQQIALFRRFPDVVNVDGTHATNRFGYKLYTFLITGGMGTGRPVMYAFVESEQFAPMRRLFGLFKEMMGEQYPVRTFVMDKLAAQMRVARVVFGCDVMLCYFHIRKAIRKHTTPYSRFLLIVLHTHRFRQDLQLLRRTDARFVSYLTARWLYITRKWAVHAQSGMVHFGNVTDNRLENANGRLKDRVHHADTLEHAIQKTRCTFVTPHELLTLDLSNQFGRLFSRALFDRFALPRVVHGRMSLKSDGFVKAMDILHKEFGRPHDIAQSFIDSILVGGPIAAEDTDALRKLVREMHSCEIALTQMGYTADLNCSTNLKRIVMRLPRHLQREWAKVADNILYEQKEPSFRQLNQFLERNLSAATNVYGQLASGAYRVSSRGVDDINRRSKLPRPHVNAVASKALSCPVCTAHHSLCDCVAFQAKSPEEKLQALRERKLCFNCLNLTTEQTNAEPQITATCQDVVTPSPITARGQLREATHFVHC
ncbi:hypothetical protein CLF_101544 [Clonorchis sinensis]|uniref:ZSWIM1/3 RNaseH-like domain-containing protein n=1 Tax=Clonorchis sinensis TaxID=79923 RepID=G7Y602_CLOSI|nr:hypothetical protein CLF_101544 [Clonorchis sinensis]